MDYDPESKAKRVLELSNSAVLEQRPRPMEAVWALIAIWLFSAYLESSDVSQYVEKKSPEQERCEIYTKALTNVLNGGGLVVEGATSVTCKARQIRAAS